MLLKICLLGCLAMLVATEELAGAAEKQTGDPETGNNFETAHKVPESSLMSDEGFHTAHKISIRATDPADYSMNLLATKERPELNPVLSALINEDVMKSIEAKRAIEEEELAEVRREIEQAALAELTQNGAITEAPPIQLTTRQPTAAKKIDNLDDDLMVDPHDDFVNKNYSLDGAGSENNKKSRIEIKKGPNGQDYEYEYVYYYEEDDDADSKAKPAIAAPAAVEPPADLTPDTRGKTRYSNIDRSTPATPSENSLQSGKAKGRASSTVSETSEDIEAERLPLNTRFPSRGKNIDVQPTPALDSLENAAERKKISVKRPSLELVDSETFNTDEKQQKGLRNSDKELKPVITVEKEAAAAAAAAAAKQREEEERQNTVKDEEAEQTTPSMEKAALDLYAILTNENLNMEETTAADGNDATTVNPDTASTDTDDASLTTLQEELSSTTASTTTTTTTTTTTEAPTTTTTTTTTTAAPSLFGGRRSGLSGLAGRNRFKLRDSNAGGSTTTTESAPTETTKTGRNRYSRPSIGGRARPGARTTASPVEHAAEPAAEEEIVPAKEVKPVSSGFARGRPRNRFNLRGASTTTTEKSAAAGEESADGGSSPDAVSTTARSNLRSRPGLNLRGRSRTTTAKPAAAEDSNADEAGNGDEGKAAAAPAAAEPTRPSRFNLHRTGGNRLLPRGKLGRAGATTESPKESPEDSAADSSHHNDVKGTDLAEGGETAEKTEESDAGNHAGPVSGLNRLKHRPRLNALHKTDAAKQRAAAAPAPAANSAAAASPASPAASTAPRKINPLLAKRRLHLGGAAAAAATSTTESSADDEQRSASDASGEQQAAKDDAATANSSDESGDSGAKEQDTTETAEATTKQQARGLGLLGQRRRLPLRKPGTIL